MQAQQIGREHLALKGFFWVSPFVFTLQVLFFNRYWGLISTFFLVLAFIEFLRSSFFKTGDFVKDLKWNSLDASVWFFLVLIFFNTVLAEGIAYGFGAGLRLFTLYCFPIVIFFIVKDRVSAKNLNRLCTMMPAA